MSKADEVKTLKEIQEHVVLGTDKVEYLQVPSIGKKMPFRPLNRKELISLSSKLTQGIKFTQDEEGNTTPEFDLEEVTMNEATVEAQAIVMGLAVSDKDGLDADTVLETWKPGVIKEMAENVFQVTGENPIQELKKEGQKRRDLFRGQDKGVGGK